ncbi:MAG: beta-N-acetylhexosaminidase [Lachnospiraceae bacterium]|nr:beta-N-acetylhexosaminidase [Lachnospiraceae bacterium]
MKNTGDWNNREQEIAEQKRERARLRHKRRVRNQIISYIVVGVFLLAVGASTYLGGLRLVGVIAEHRAAAEIAAEAEAAEQSVIMNEASSEEPETTEEPVVIMTPESTETGEPEKTDEELLDEYVDGLIAEMPLKDKVAGMFLVTPEQLTGVDAAIKAGDGTEEALELRAVGGLVYGQKNIKSSEQIAEMLQTTTNMSKYPLFLATYEPGGDAGDLTKALSLDHADAPSALAEAGNISGSYEAGEALAKRLVTAGFNMDLAPAVNLTTESMEEKARKVSFGSEPASAAQLLAEEVRGLEENGVHTVAGLFPTIRGTSDSNIPSTDAGMEDLEDKDFLMFQAAIGAGTDIVMVGNLAAPKLVGDNTPCVMSQTIVTDILRGKLGFEGVVVTDAMDTAAITDYYTADQAAVAAIKAGVDMILRPEKLDEAMDGVVDAVNSGVIAEDRIDASLKRIYRIKYANVVHHS